MRLYVCMYVCIDVYIYVVCVCIDVCRYECLYTLIYLCMYVWMYVCMYQCMYVSFYELVNKFTYLGTSVSSTETDIDTRLAKAWTAINSLSFIWKLDLTDKMKRSFFQAAVVSILLYGCTTWTLTKRLEKKLDDNYTKMLRAILNKFWRQHPTKQ